MAQFAVIKTGGKQYLVEPGQKLKIEKLAAEAGKDIVLDEVLLVGDEKNIEVGTPQVKGAQVTAKVLQQGRAKKVIVFHYRAKTRYHKKAGHRQPFTEVEITKISAGK
ncbi:50S ribosomal protein L21 [Candidatus Parcubacteria bacterium]|nr:50S ribosomal protein L21 [Candidatus Parcubacteria bacterium]